MSGISKRVSGSWVSGDYGIMKTATDTITTLPADIYANAATATVGVKGQTVQSGTPSPQNPVMPQGCGDRTENLFDYSTIITGYRIVWATGELFESESGIISDYIEVDAGQQYSISDSTKTMTAYILGYNQNKEYLGVYNSTEGFIKASTNRYSSCTIPNDSRCKYIKLMTYSFNDLEQTSMFTKGSTAPTSFIPYGVKIPISCGGTTNNVYLGEVQTTRKVKKYKFTGEENLIFYGAGASGVGFRLTVNEMLYNGRDNGLCTHFVPTYVPAGATGDAITFGAANSIILFSFSAASVSALNLSDLPSIKTWLQQQYAAGTPVTVWYVLAEPTTGIVNEPIRKIGDYADTVSGITIPTITGKDSFDVLTTLKPSEVELTYTGWHDASAKEWDGSEWQ